MTQDYQEPTFKELKYSAWATFQKLLTGDTVSQNEIARVGLFFGSIDRALQEARNGATQPNISTQEQAERADLQAFVGRFNGVEADITPNGPTMLTFETGITREERDHIWHLVTEHMQSRHTLREGHHA